MARVAVAVQVDVGPHRGNAHLERVGLAAVHAAAARALLQAQQGFQAKPCTRSLRVFRADESFGAGPRRCST